MDCYAINARYVAYARYARYARYAGDAGDAGDARDARYARYSLAQPPTKPRAACANGRPPPITLIIV